MAPLAMIGVCGYWLFGVSAYDCPGSYLLTRPWQGKTMLWSLGLPLLVLALWTFYERPNFRTWVPCLLASIGALAMSSSAVYLVILLVPLFWTAMRLWGRRAAGWRHFAVAIAVVAPELVYGLLVRGAAAGYAALSDRPSGSCWLQSLHWGCIEYGSSELLWLAAVPLLAVMLPSGQSRAYLIGLPALLAATALNPLAYEMAASHLTSYHTHHRLFWLVPFGMGLGALTAVVSDRLAGCITAYRPGNAVIALCCSMAMVASLALLPGRCAWSKRNEGPFPGLCFAWGENPYKMPDDLLQVVRRVERDAAKSTGRLLLPEHLAQFFAPYTSRLRFVSTRPTHTVEALTANDRPAEGLERVMLVNRLLGTTGTEYLVRQRQRAPLDDSEVKQLFAKYEVDFVVIDDCPVLLKRQLTSCGFALAHRAGRYQYWRRETARRTTRCRPASTIIDLR